MAAFAIMLITNMTMTMNVAIMGLVMINLRSVTNLLSCIDRHAYGGRERPPHNTITDNDNEDDKDDNHDQSFISIWNFVDGSHDANGGGDRSQHGNKITMTTMMLNMIIRISSMVR